VALVSRAGREQKAAETYLGSWGPVVVLTALGEGKLFNDRSVEGQNKFLGVAENGDGVGLGTGAGSLAGFPVGRRRGGRDRGVFFEGG
jgi:hypothetical protein